MSYKDQLREQRYNTVINHISKHQEYDCLHIGKSLPSLLQEEFSVKLTVEEDIKLVTIILLQKNFPEIDFHRCFDSPSMRPDGGLLYLIDKKGHKFLTLITEVKIKEQMTCDCKKGNAIECLGKNVIGFHTLLLKESIFPFVCFGYGCDFEDTSSILDRVVTIAMYGQLNTIYLHNKELFNRGSFFFRRDKWTAKGMFDTMYEIAKGSISYYFSKYGEDSFV